MIYFTPIWDVLVHQGEQVQVLIHLSTHSRCPVFPIRQAVPVGLAQALDCCWGHWAWYFIPKKLYTSEFNTFMCNLHFFNGQGKQEWVDGFG